MQPEYEGWKRTLNALLSVLGKVEYRTRFDARCMQGATHADVS